MRVMATCVALAMLMLPMMQATAAGKDDVIVVSEKDIARYWKAPGIDTMTFGRSRAFRYGCVNIGFFIETNGKVSTPIKPLSIGYDNPKAHGKIEAWFYTQLNTLLSQFLPADSAKQPQTTFTSRSVPIFTKKFEQQLSPQQQKKLADALREACRIDDLAGKLSDGADDATKVTLDPAIEALLTQE